MVNNKTIRTLTVNALKANSNVTALVAATKIHNSKVTPHMFGNLPAIGVFITNSAAQGVNHLTPEFVRAIDVNIEVIVSGTEDYMDNTDDIIFAIKRALFGNTVWTGQFENTAGYTEETNLDDAGEKPMALSTLTINCEIVENN